MKAILLKPEVQMMTWMSAVCLKRTCAKVMSNVRFTLEADTEDDSKKDISHSQHESPNPTHKKTSA